MSFFGANSWDLTNLEPQGNYSQPLTKRNEDEFKRFSSKGRMFIRIFIDGDEKIYQFKKKTEIHILVEKTVKEVCLGFLITNLQTMNKWLSQNQSYPIAIKLIYKRRNHID